jgi:UDP-N-acetylglucosamine diphosphorylase/glucosamine-1-phosphate N-acetyltransferase
VSEPLLIVVDDAVARAFAPFASMRAWSAMPVGALPVHDRWAVAFPGHRVHVAAAAHLAGLTDTGTPTAAPNVLPAGTIVAHSRAVCALQSAPSAEAWTMNGAVAAVRLATATALDDVGATPFESLASSAHVRAALAGRWVDAPWDPIAHLSAVLSEDLAALALGIDAIDVAPAVVLGDHAVTIEAGAVVEPYVVIDASLGPVVVRRGAQVHAFTRLAGPCYIGEDTHLLGGRISGSVIGPQCRVHGDVSASIFAGYVNKAHEGFVGHTIVGRWANLGAGTTTSNLKNSYGAVRLWTPAGDRSTGLTFLGSLIGEHAKIGIGTMLGTGTVVGPGANLFGTLRPPKMVPPFAWGDAPPYETFSRDKFLDVAARVMSRRHVSLDDAMRAALGRAYDAALAGAP